MGMPPLDTHGDANTDMAAIVRLLVPSFQLILEDGALSRYG